MIRFSSQHNVPFSREALWGILSKTDWLNRSLGLPPVKYEITPRREGGSSTLARARFLGMELRWQEFPFEWLEPEFYRVHRVFETGPFTEARVGMDFSELPGGHSQVTSWSELVPRNIWGKWIAHWLLGPKTGRNMQQIVTHAAEFLSGQARAIMPKLPVQQVNEAALQAGLKKLRALGQPDELIQRLAQFLRESPDVSLSHIRPLAVSRDWNRDVWEVLRMFLHAPQCGLLDLSWEVLCPNCRSTKQSPVSSLSQLKRGSHCEVCQIAFDAEFDQSVELKFAVNPAIRPREEQTFCLAGPGGKPHVLSQLWLQPGEKRSCKWPASNRFLRLRSPQVAEPATFRAEETPQRVQRYRVICHASRFEVSQLPAPEQECPALIENPNSFSVLLTWETPEWNDTILTAARVTNWQEFRDLFATEVISPHEQVVVGSQVILFTDLRGSTAMYQNLGDAPAYARVRDHFSILMEAVRARHGSVVKTIGDAVMAVFSRVDEALEAVREMHRGLGAASGTSAPLALKSSLHVGSCLAVNANDKLDFFGSTVNLAARMVECSQGGDLVISDELFRRPETTQFLKTVSEAPVPTEMRFRGFDTPYRVWRIQLG